MKSFLFFANIKLPYQSLAIGKFDGMHKAHIKLLDLVGKDGIALSIAQVSASFITPPQERQRYTQVPFYRLRFDSIKTYSPMQFLELLFFIMPNLKRMIVGYDFCFGKDRIGSVSDIKSLLVDMGKSQVEVVILQSQKYNDMPIHTSIIKELMRYGDIKNANAMLGRFYAIRGHIISGQGIGSKQLYPTINIKTSLYTLPKYGVYAGFCSLNNRKYKAVIFIGNRLSTDRHFCIESHILEECEIIAAQGQKAEVYFVERIRDNKKFNNLQDLKAQITQDIYIAKEILQNKEYCCI